MSQPDLLDELRAARPTAPDVLRARVRAVAVASSTPPSRRLTWRRATLALAPALAALVVAALVLGHDRGSTTAARTDQGETSVGTIPTGTVVPQRGAVHGAAAGDARSKALGTVAQPSLGSSSATQELSTPAPPPGRVVRYSTYLELRLRTPNAVSRATQRALRVTRTLGGYPARMNVDARGRRGDATLVLRIPRAHVQAAVERLSALGTIVGENVQLQDLEAGLNATGRTVARLQKKLRDLRAQTQTDAIRRAIVVTTVQIARLQRGSAQTRRSAHYATVNLELHTPTALHRPEGHGHGPLHGLGVAFRWIGIGAVYALALGGPLVALALLAWLAARVVRRRREDALLGTQ